MAGINNSDLTRQLIDGAKINTSFDKVPNQLAEKVVPVMEVNPELLRKITVVDGEVRTTTGTLTGYTTSPTKKFFLTGFSASIIKDATCDLSTGGIYVQCTKNGVLKTLLSFSTITTTAQDHVKIVQLSKPVELDKNTAILFTGTFSAGVMVRTLAIQGFEVD